MTENDLEKFEPAATVLKAMAHPHRIAILSYLNENDKLCVTDICLKLDVHQVVASQHLKLMKQNGLLNRKRSGKNSYYSLNRDNLEKLSKYFYIE